MLETGFYRNFKGEDAFLFSGSLSQVLILRNLLYEISIPESSVSFSTSFLFGNAIWAVHVSFRSAAKRGSFFRIVTEEMRQASWELSTPEANALIHLLDGLISSEKPGHIYFDGDKGSVLVVVSMNEGP